MALIVGVSLGAILLVRSLVLLFGLFLRGRFDPHVVEAEPVRTTGRRPAHVQPQLGVAALACLVVGATLTFFFEASWAHIIGVPALLAFVGLGFVALASLMAAGDQADE